MRSIKAKIVQNLYILNTSNENAIHIPWITCQIAKYLMNNILEQKIFTWNVPFDIILDIGNQKLAFRLRLGRYDRVGISD